MTKTKKNKAKKKNNKEKKREGKEGAPLAAPSSNPNVWIDVADTPHRRAKRVEPASSGATALLPGFIGVLLGITGFYWVLLGFIGFYWVLLVSYWI